MDDEFALFAAEISKLDEEAPPSTSGAAAGSGRRPSEDRGASAARSTVNLRPKVIAKAPEHVPAGPAARPPRRRRYLPVPPRRTGTTKPPASQRPAPTCSEVGREWRRCTSRRRTRLPSGVNGVAHGDLGSIPPPRRSR